MPKSVKRRPIGGQERGEEGKGERGEEKGGREGKGGREERRGAASRENVR